MDEEVVVDNIAARFMNVELFSCLVCQVSYARKEDLMKHLSKIHRLVNLCKLCYFNRCEIQRFSNAVSLRNHKLRDHSEDMVECVCGSLFIDEKMLTSHLKKFKCFSRSNDDTTEQDMVKCICGKRFENNELMLYHRKYKCRKRTANNDDEDDQLDNANFSRKKIPKAVKCETVSNEYEDGKVSSTSKTTAETLNTESICSDNGKEFVISPKVASEQFLDEMNNNKDSIKKSEKSATIAPEHSVDDMNNNNIVKSDEKVDLNRNTFTSGH